MKEKLTINALKKKLELFYPDLTYRDYKFLFKDQKYMTCEELCNLLIDNEVTGFDPFDEAFRLFDPKSTG